MSSNLTASAGTRPAVPADRQDKRAVVPIDREDWERWLMGSADEALQLVKVPPCERIAHGAADPARQVQLPIL